MSDDDKPHKNPRRFDPAQAVGQSILGPLLGGISSGLAAKMNERTLLAAAALQGILASEGPESVFNDAGYAHTAMHAQRFADALLMRLAEVPDPRGAPEK